MSNTKEKLNTYVALKFAVQLLTDSADAEDLCLRITHSEIFDGMCRGASIFLLDQKSSLNLIAEYGDSLQPKVNQISAWDDNFISVSVRSRSVSYFNTPTVMRSSMPIEIAGVVRGALVFTFSPDFAPLNPSNEVTKLLANMAGLFMDTKGQSLPTRNAGSLTRTLNRVATIQELTTRQVQILQYVADGLTNAEISKVVLLSESTVRQETIRIFRVLGCNNRAEAIVKGRELGLVASVRPLSSTDSATD